MPTYACTSGSCGGEGRRGRTNRLLDRYIVNVRELFEDQLCISAPATRATNSHTSPSSVIYRPVRRPWLLVFATIINNYGGERGNPPPPPFAGALSDTTKREGGRWRGRGSSAPPFLYPRQHLASHYWYGFNRNYMEICWIILWPSFSSRQNWYEGLCSVHCTVYDQVL
jgi:hypothetical protein